MPNPHEYQQRAKFISFTANDNPQTKPRTSAKNSYRWRTQDSSRILRVRNPTVRVVPHKYSQSVEEDFMQRILEDRDPSSGPYSNPTPLLQQSQNQGTEDERNAQHAEAVAGLPRSGVFRADIRHQPPHPVVNPKPEPYDHASYRTPLRSQMALGPFSTPDKPGITSPASERLAHIHPDSKHRKVNGTYNRIESVQALPETPRLRSDEVEEIWKFSQTKTLLKQAQKTDLGSSLSSPCSEPTSSKESRSSPAAHSSHTESTTAQVSAADTVQSRLLRFKKRIGRAIERKSASSLREVREEAQREYASVSSNSLPSELSVYLLMGFMAVHQPESAISVWNDMIEQQLQPGVEHWDAMLKGCALAKDPDSLEKLWHSMIDAGVVPDTQAWATRIHGLAANQRSTAALCAFEEMAKSWLDEAARRRLKPRNLLASEALGMPAKPNAQCLNVLVNGLAKKRRYDGLIKAFAWLEPLRIRPDIYTFNSLFRSALMDNDVKIANAFLQQMRKYGTEPNIATFTMILGALFSKDHGVKAATNVTMSYCPTQSNDSSASTESRGDLMTVLGSTSGQRALGPLFKLMTEQSVHPTAQTFSTLITGLLKMTPPNVTAAYAVLKYITVNALPVSSRIYTSIARLHFHQQPPDLESVEALWHHARARTKGTNSLILDDPFYDTFVGGWAKAGAYGRSFRSWQSAAREGRCLSYASYKALASALIDSGNRTRARTLFQHVQKVENTGGSLLESTLDRAGFWAWVKRAHKETHLAESGNHLQASRALQPQIGEAAA